MLREHRDGHLVHLEGAGDSRVDGQMDEQVDDLFLGPPVVERDAQLAAQRLSAPSVAAIATDTSDRSCVDSAVRVQERGP